MLTLQNFISVIFQISRKGKKQARGAEAEEINLKKEIITLVTCSFLNFNAVL